MKLSNDNEKDLENAKHFQKKLLIATDNFLPRWDGIARFLSELIPRLKEYKITVICPDFGNVSMEDVEIIKIPLSKLKIGDYTAAKFKPKIIKEKCKEADIIFTQTIGPIGLLAIWYGKKYKKPIISYIHSLEWELVTKSAALKGIKNFFIYNLIKLVAWFFYNKSTLLITPSPEVAEILSWQRIKTNKSILHMGVNINKFAPPRDKAEAKRKININPEKKVIGFVGRLGREKDPRTLYRAFTRLKNKYNILLLIIGGGIEELENLFKNKEDIIWISSTDNVADYLQAMDIYVLPSLTETSSLSTMEAMSCQLAVVVTPIGYIKEYIKNNINGLFFPRQNSYILEKKIEMVLDDKLRNKISVNARKTIEEKFSFDRTVEAIKRVLEIY